MQIKSSKLFYWCLWFFLGNVLLFWIIGLNYIPTLPWINTASVTHHAQTVSKVFAVFTYLGQLSLIALLPLLFLLPLAKIFPKKSFICSLAVLAASSSAILLIIDSITYKIYRFHLNGVLFDLARHNFGEVFAFSNYELYFPLIIVCGLLALELCYAVLLWRYWVGNKYFQSSAKWILILLGVCLYISYNMILFSSGLVLHRVFADESRVFPLYNEIFGAILPIKNGRILLERISESYMVQPEQANGKLNYPLHPLHSTLMKNPLNLVVIVIDAWRFDMLDPDNSPALYRFANKSMQFTNHVSGGNATGPGIFSLFYGLPATYWTAMEMQHQGPVLIDQLLKHHYQMGIFSSATLTLPPFNKTVFTALRSLTLKQTGKTPHDKDLQVTNEFNQFIKANSVTKQPFFSFLFYDGVHSYCTYKEDLGPLQPAIAHCKRMKLTNQSDPNPYLNRYKNAVRLVDQQIQQVLRTLEKEHLLANTVVLVTGDHGEEFNDNHLGFWGHASNFTRYQTRTPLIVYWPDKKPKIFTHQTTHFDIAPTLMKDLFNIQDAPATYSVGLSLFNAQKRPYLIIGGYSAFGIVEPDRITRIFSTGNYQIEQPNGQPISSVNLREPTIHQCFQDLRRFYRNLSV